MMQVPQQQMELYQLKTNPHKKCFYLNAPPSQYTEDSYFQVSLKMFYSKIESNTMKQSKLIQILMKNFDLQEDCH